MMEREKFISIKSKKLSSGTPPASQRAAGGGPRRREPRQHTQRHVRGHGGRHERARDAPQVQLQHGLQEGQVQPVH